MKKKILIGLVISIAILGYFYPNRGDDEVIKSVEIQKIIKLDKNITVVTEQKINQPPTVDAGDDQNITFGDEVRLEAIAKDSDGEVASYLWREGNRTLSEEERFDYKFDKGIHHLTVTVTDNDGAEAEDNVTVNVGIWVLDKIITMNRRGDSGRFNATIHYEYNSDGKITKTMIDLNQDDVVNQVYYYGYDKDGKDTFTAVDFDNDGYIDRNSSPSFSRRVENGYEKWYINGEKSIFTKVETKYNEAGNILETITLKDYLKAYRIDDEGNIVEVEPYSEIDKTKYHYNEDNQLLEVISIDNGKKYINEKYHYQNGQLTLKEYFYDGKLSSQERYIYEEESLKESEYIDYEDGNISRTVHKYYNEKGLLENDEKTKYFYDKNNRVVVEESDNKKYLYFYDNEGNNIEEKLYKKNEDGEFEPYWSRLYDGDKEEFLSFPKHISIIDYDYFSKKHIGKVMIYERRDVYDEHKNLIEIWDDADGKLVEKRFYRFVYNTKES